MNSINKSIRIGLLRSKLELKQFLRQRESVVFTLFFPVILLFIFGSVFQDTIAPGVTFSQYFVAGMVASGLVNTGFQQLAITIPMERDDGTLKRLRGTPMSVTSYFIGKALLVTILMIIQTALLLFFGTALFGSLFPLKWLTQGMRSVFLPDDFASQEVAGNWEIGRTALVLFIWLLVGLVLAIKTFKWSRE